MPAGRIRDNDIEELRERADIVEVISEYVQLKKAGRYMKGLCPFHDEKTPSFSVDPIKQLYHCFGCAEGGNVYSFLMKKEGLEFREAVERLAQRTGYQLTYEGTDQEFRKQEGRKERLVRLHRLAADSYAEQLYAGAGAKARRYLEGRGLEEATWKEFGLGYSPQSWDFLYRQAVQAGFNPQEIGESGLFVRGERGVFDRFRNRVIFPIESTRDEVIGLGGRIIEQGKNEPKYMNSPETPIFFKSKNLYALNRARREIMRLGYAVIVEGYTDVIFLWQAGIRNAVATLGTALGEEHFRMLSRLTKKVILAFDADSAGLDASERGLAYLLTFELDFRVLRLPAGKDPADFIRDAGKEAFLQLVDESKSIVEFALEKTLSAFDPSDLASRQKGIEESINLIFRLNVELSVDELLKKVADWAGSDYRPVQDFYALKHRERLGRPGSGKGAGKEALAGLLSGDVRAEEALLGILLQNPWMIDEYYTWLDEELFSQPSSRLVVKAISALYEEGEGISPDSAAETFSHDLLEHCESKDSKNLVISLMFREEAGGDQGEEALQALVSDLFARLKDFYIERQIRDLKKELAGLESLEQRDHEKEEEKSREIFLLEKRIQDGRRDK